MPIDKCHIKQGRMSLLLLWQIAYHLFMIIEIKEGNKQFTTSADLLFGLRKEDAMKPIELQNAIEAAETAWNMYDAAIDAGASKEERQERWNVVNWLEERKGQQYAAWQNAGGTSDIDCVTFNEEAAELFDTDTRGDMLDMPGAKTGISQDIIF